MNGLDQAFFDAYRSTPGEPSRQTNRPEQPVPSGSQPGSASNGRSRYRVDGGLSASAVPAPHRMPKSQAVPPRPYAIEVTTWDSQTQLSPETVFVTADVTPWGAQRAAFEAAAALPPEADAQAAGPQAAAERQSCPPSAPQAPSGGQPKSPLRPLAAGFSPPESEKVLAPESSEPAGAVDNPPLVSFKPVWEVDRFNWSADIERLYAAESAYFGHAGQKLRDAAHEGLRVLAVASSQAGAGCTTLAICLARAASDAGVRVALIDANTRAPQLGGRMGIKFPHAWTEALDGSVPLGETAITSLDRPITLLPLSPGDSAGVTLADAAVSQVIRSVAASVELAIVDMGAAVEHFLDGCTLAAQCIVDAAIVVRDLRRTSEQETVEIAVRLKAAGVNAVGVAENYAPRQQVATKAAA